MSTLLPLIPSVPYSRFTIDLDDEQYVVVQRWNSRDRAWFLDFLESNDKPIALGVKVVLGVYLGRRRNHDLFTLGAFQAYDLSGKGAEATFDDIGTRVEVWHMTIADLLGQLLPSEEIGNPT